MKKVLTILLLIFIYSFCKAQYSVPRGNPQQNGFYYNFYGAANGGFVLVDSLLMFRNSDTTMKPLFPGIKFYNSVPYYWDMSKWNAFGSGGGGSQSWDDVMTVSPDINSSYTSDFNGNDWTLTNLDNFIAATVTGFVELSAGAGTILDLNPGGTFSLQSSTGTYQYSNLNTITNISTIATWSGSNLSRSTFSDVADSLAPYFPSSESSFTWSVLDSLGTAPGSPATGDVYLVGTPGTGFSPVPVNDIATWDGAAWDDGVPSVGDLLYNNATDYVSKWTGTVWIRISKATIHQGGDAFGVNNMRIGTNNNRAIQFETNNTVRFTIGQTGTYTFATLTGASDGIMGLSTTGLASNVQAGTGVVITSSLIRVDTATIHTSAYNDGRYLQNITGLVTAGSGISVTGSGTSGSPYIVAATGGGGEDLETTMDIGSVLSQDHTIDHTGFALATTGLNFTMNADNVLRGAAVDSVAFTSLATLDLQAGTEMKMKTVTGTFDATTRASFGFRTGTSDSVFFEAKSEVMRFIAPVTSNISANAAIKTMVRDTITGQIGWANAAGVALTTNQIGVGIASVLNSYSTFQYNGTTQTINNNGIGTTQTDALNITNSTAATSGQPQYSGRQNFFGSSYNTTGSVAITQGVGISFIPYSGAVATNVGYLAYTYYDAGYGSTPTLAIQKNHVMINRGSTTASGAALDITENSGESALILRDDGGVNSRTFSVSSTGILTISSTQSGTVSAGSFEGGLTTGSGGVGTVNLFAGVNSNISQSGGAAIAGSANLTSVKVISNGTTTQTPTANLNYTNFYIGANAVTKAATGTHDIFTNLAIQGLNINSGAGTLTKTASFLINGIATGTGVPAGAYDNYSMWVYSGPSRFGGGMIYPYVAKTGTYTATVNDYMIECTANTFTVTLPTAVGCAGLTYVITNSGAGTITIGTTSSQTFVNVTATPTTLTLATVGSYIVSSNGANWLVN